MREIGTLARGGQVGELKRPRALRPGDRVDVVVPSGGVDPERLAAGVAVLERRGSEVTVRSPSASYRYFSGRDEERRRALLEAFGEPSVRAVWLARGGYGMNRLLPGLDVEWLREHAKLCIGFSDATALLEVLVQRAGVAAIHGPMVAHDVAREDGAGGLDHLLAIASGARDWSIAVPRGIAAGEANAPLIGGCLAVLASLAGTPFAPSFHGAIALLEDTNERPQRRVDRMLVQLRQSRMLDGVRGVIFGAMPDCGPEPELLETIFDCLGDLGVPIGFGAPLGHGSRHLAVPLGVAVRLRVDAVGDASACVADASPQGRLEGVDAVVEG
jgi:muramoyltetrapeptide carboxypeptidase